MLRHGTAQHELEATTGRMDKLAARLGAQRDRLDKLGQASQRMRERLQNHDKRIAGLKSAVDELNQTLLPELKTLRLRELDHRRAMYQLAALEQRVSRIEEKVQREEFNADDDSLAEARSLVDTVRREHDQARVRFQVISSYEERLRRLEATVIDMYDGDVRHPL